MVRCIQSGLRALIKTFWKVVLVDDVGYMLIDQHGDPEVKVTNPRVELPYTYLVAWYIMHCPSLMMAVHALKDFVPFCAEIGML